MEQIVEDEGDYDNVLSYKEEGGAQDFRHPDSTTVQSEEGFVEDVVEYENISAPLVLVSLCHGKPLFNIDVQLIFTKQLRDN